MESTCDEGQDLGRLLIEPLGIVDDTQDRDFSSRMSEQGQGGEANQEAIGRSTGDQSERRTEGITLRFWKAPKIRQRRNQQLVEGRETELDLRLDPREPSDLEAGSARGNVFKQGGLADAGLTPDDKRSAHPPPNGT